jgi:hypothetical protein
MKKIITAVHVTWVVSLFFAAAAFGAGRSAPLIINHLNTDLSQIPLVSIHSIQNDIKVQYGHQSHGLQLTTGLDMIEFGNSAYADTVGGQTLPIVPGSLCFDGTGATPEQYWATAAGMNSTRNILRAHLSISVSMFCWCVDLDTASVSYVQAYVDSMSKLETEFPSVTFIYMTGNACMNGAGGYNRHLRNEQIRQYCVANNKVLYDFADLDSWYFNPATQGWEQATYVYSGTVVPVQHPQFVNPQCGTCGHANRGSCIQKGNAVWWLMAVLNGWSIPTAVGGGSGDGVPPRGFQLSCYPNPFNPSTTITFSLAETMQARLAIYDAGGALVKTLICGSLGRGAHSINWNGSSNSGAPIASGVYFYRITAGNETSTKKILLLR